MSLAQVLRPKEPRHLTVTLVACALLVGAYAASSLIWPWSPKRGLGLLFGFLAALLFGFEMLYPARRPRARPLRTAKSWLQAHVYLGLVAFLSVLIHADFAWPRGLMGWGLLLLSGWTTLTGLAGVWLQKWIPQALADGLRVEALYERIPALVEGLCGEADALLADASDVLARFYRTELRGRLSALSPSGAYLLDVRAGRERALEPLRRLAQFVEPAEQQTLQDLTGIYSDKLELDAQYSLQTVLRSWILLHVPPAGLLLALMLVHVFSWLWY